MTEKTLQELDREHQIAQILQWLKDDKTLLDLFLADPQKAFAQIKATGHIPREDAERQVERHIKKFGFEEAYERYGKGVRTVLKLPVALPAMEGKAGRPERIVSTGFATETEASEPIKPAMPLMPQTAYYFWFEVGAPVAGSIEVVPTELPDEIPPGAELDVALFSFAGEIELIPDKDVGKIRIESDGTVTVLARVAEPAVGEEMLGKRLFFPVQTAANPGPQRLRCNIYYQQTLVQSRLVTAQVKQQPAVGAEPALTSVVDYTLSKALDGRVLAGMGQNRLSLMLNDNGNGTHGFRLFGADEQEAFKNDATFDAHELQALVQMARAGLRKAAWGDDEPFKSGKIYQYDDFSEERLRKHLISLAVRGRRIYADLVKRLAGDIKAARQLGKLMLKPGQIQIASKESARLIIPAAVFYDYRLDDGKESSAYSICPTFLEALRTKKPLDETVCFQGACPTRDDKVVICPSGFWGFRHQIGLPVSVREAPDAPTAIPYASDPKIAMSVSIDPNFIERPGHEQRLDALGIRDPAQYADTRDEAIDLMLKTQSQVVYFYCHGGFSNGVPYLSVGPTTSDWLTTTTLFDEEIYWEEVRPLVFINGCHTTALEPEVALDFVDEFVTTANAAGVIGTEITIFEPIATTFAEECFRRFLIEKQTLGEAVRGARVKMLQAGNPLGLVYIPYAMPGLKLAPANA